MRRFLLDTHALLWWFAEPTKLSADARDIIASGSNAMYFSTAAAWEVSIKKNLGRLDFPTNLSDVLAKDHIEVLPIGLPHALAVTDLPLHHQDPFDRMQIAQAQIENLTVITRDKSFSQYDVPVIKA